MVSARAIESHRGCYMVRAFKRTNPILVLLPKILSTSFPLPKRKHAISRRNCPWSSLDTPRLHIACHCLIALIGTGNRLSKIAKIPKKYFLWGGSVLQHLPSCLDRVKMRMAVQYSVIILQITVAMPAKNPPLFVGGLMTMHSPMRAMLCTDRILPRRALLVNMKMITREFQLLSSDLYGRHASSTRKKMPTPKTTRIFLTRFNTHW
mmetsp:Transcript_653/g.1331  ORF Transcript_653/g.1331 Transcript_653/m.1331 type:complete len:207 (+) Transcript_653:50-670(+)